MNIAALRPVLCMPGCASRSSSSTLACGASACAHDAPAMPAPTITASKVMPTPDAAWRPTPPQGGDTSGPAKPDPRCPLGRECEPQTPSTIRWRPHERALAEQALDQVDRKLGGLVAHVARRVEFHHVERCQRA